MTICLINNLYKPYTRGGAEKVLETIHDNLERLGHRVVVISSEPRFISSGKKNVNNHRIKSFYYNLGKMPVFFRLFWHFYDMFDIFSALRIKNILKQEKPDLVITNNLKGISFLLPLFINRLKIRHVHILHDIQLLHPSGLMMYGQEKTIDSVAARIYQSVSRYFFSFSGKIISPSKWLLDLHLRKKFFQKNKTEIVPNPIDIRQQKLPNGGNKIFKFLYVGQVEKFKGVDFLIDVFAGLQDVELEIIGDGSFLAQAIKKAEHAKNITLGGRKTKEEVAVYMSHADCLIVPSLCYENSPTVIYEAMSLSLPIMASEIGGITELIRKSGGILFEPGNSHDLKEKIIQVMRNTQKIEDFKKNYPKMIDDYAIEKYLQKILKNISDTD